MSELGQFLVVLLFFVWAGCALIWIGKVVADWITGRDES